MDNVCLISEDPDPIHDGLKRNISNSQTQKLLLVGSDNQKKRKNSEEEFL